MFRRNLGLQLLALYLIFVVPVLAGAWFIGSDASARLEQDVQAADLALARAIALETDVFIDNALRTVVQLAGTPEVQSLNTDHLAHLFAPITAARNEVNLVYILDGQGIMRYHYPEGPGSTVGNDFSARQYFKDARTARAPLVSIGRISPTTGQPVVTAVMPILDASGNFRGVVATNLELSKLSLPLREITANRANGQRVSILDASGQIIADSDTTKLLTDARAEFPAGTDAVLRGETDSQLSPDHANRQELYSYAPISAVGWGVVVQRPAEIAFAVPREFRAGLVIAVAVFLAGGLLFWLILSRRVIVPLESLAAFSAAIGKRAVVAADHARLAQYARRGDQIGGLTRAVTQMERDIERRIDEQATLLQTSTAVVASLDAEKVLNTILDQVQRLLSVQSCAILAWDEDTDHVQVPAARGLSAAYLSSIHSLNDDDRTMLPALRAGAVIQVGDIETALDLPASARERARAEGHRAFLVVPLLASHAPLAVLVVYWREPHIFSPEEIALITAFANQAALAMENAALFARSDEKLRESEERWRRLSDAAFEGIVIHDAGKILDANRVFAAMFGYAHDEIIGKNILDLAAPESRERVKQTMLAGGEAPYEAIGLRKDGTTFIGELRGKPIPYQGRLVRVSTLRDITERKEMEEKLKELSIHDALSGLYNRRFLEEEMTRLERGRQFPVSIVMADLNHLKETNDGEGHAAGDALIQRAAQVLNAAFRADDIIARIGGDEFAVLLPNTDTALAGQLLSRVRRALETHNAAHGGAPLSIAFGVSTSDLGGALTDTLKEADARMYEEKHGHDPKTTPR